VERQGSYQVQHLRPNPEKLSEFMEVWNRALAAAGRGDQEEEQRLLKEELRQFQVLVAVDEFHNLVTTLGKNDLNDKYFRGAAYTQTVRMGLKGAGAAAAGDTQASHAGWLEQGLANAPTYAGNRKDVTLGVAAAGVSVSPVQAFAITSTGTVAGCFMNNGGAVTKDDTTGVLFSAGDFSAPGSRSVVNLDTLNVTYTFTTA
jgi:hypothetical protein